MVFSCVFPTCVSIPLILYFLSGYTGLFIVHRIHEEKWKILTTFPHHYILQKCSILCFIYEYIYKYLEKKFALNEL